MSDLLVRDLVVNYGKIRAVKGVSLDVPSGGIVAILGSNGAGKSTILKSIMGIASVRSGSVIFDGKQLHKMTPSAIVRSGVSISPEGRRLFPDMTVRENLLMGGYQRRRSELDELIDGVFERFPILAERTSQRAGTLSGGEQQMVAIGRALMSKPDVILFDEPSLGLAPMLVRQVEDIINEVRADGVSVILVEQNARMALRVSDSAYVLETGRVVLSGTSEELLEDEGIQRTYLGGGSVEHLAPGISGEEADR